MAESDQTNAGDTPQTRPDGPEAKKPKEPIRFGVKLRTNAIIDGKLRKAGETISATSAQAIALERDGTIRSDD